MQITEKIKIGWNFDNSYAQLSDSFWTGQLPTQVRAPNLSMLNEPLAKSLGLNAEHLKNDDAVAIFAGNKMPKGAFPLAQVYAGHQYGTFRVLGDGRAILIGEQITPSGERFDIQLKGSGRTPYSYKGDGKATHGPMLREYIISEAMYALGIPGTRSLAVVTTGEVVMRQNKPLPGAVLVRVASSHLRIGTFLYMGSWGTVEELKQLADYTINRHYPYIASNEDRYVILLQEIMKRQASLTAQWQLVGFIHGILGTDNIAISGETIDFGPCAFMDEYDPATVFSSIDKKGRFAYGNQPSVSKWNLTRLAESFLPLLDNHEEKAGKIVQESLVIYDAFYNNYWLSGMRAKLGIHNEEEQDQTLMEELLQMMGKYHADYTNTFRSLTYDRFEDNELFSSQAFKKWYTLWQERLNRQPETKVFAKQLMLDTNPAIIPRNHLVEAAIEAAVERGDHSVMERLLTVLTKPFAHTSDQEEFAKLPHRSKRPSVTFCGT